MNTIYLWVDREKNILNTFEYQNERRDKTFGVCRIVLSRPWMDVFALPEKSNMAVPGSDPDPKVRKMSMTF